MAFSKPGIFSEPMLGQWVDVSLPMIHIGFSLMLVGG